MKPPIVLAAAALAFSVLATANSGGYRFGISDQAFYATAVVKDLHPSFFPRDTPLLNAQARLQWSDEIVAVLSRTFHVDLPPLFLAIYMLTLASLFFAAIAFARAAGFSWWAVAVLLFLLTFRHRIARTGANSLEGYMHPRELAFSLGVAAFACLVGGRHVLALVWIALAACWHPTTAFWFGIVAAVAMLTDQPAYRRPIAVAGLLAVVVALWSVVRGPLAGRLVVMDPAWLAVLADKDYLFPHEWPAYAWMANLAYPIITTLIWRRRQRTGHAVAGERYLLAGLWVLVGLFFLSVPLTAWRLALPVQMQVTRVFWLLDFVTAAYVAWWLADDALGGRQSGRWAVIALLATLSIGRGYYLAVRQEGRQLLALNFPESDWIDAMEWLKAQPPSLYVLADPGHAWKYGVSARLAAEKDTLIEAGKDTALAIYDRNVAMQIADRLAAVGDFGHLSASGARALRERYGLDVVVLDAAQPIELRELFRNRAFVIYDLR